ncbi:MAG TPA: hypothetical protein VJ692_11110 [Nitrospiraceae bacterium]|nr:hypothetical protein [Nitrospiraceae bacterium]
MDEQSRHIVVLGAGYTGRYIYAQAEQSRQVVFATSRSPEWHLATLPASHRLEFDLERHETWQNIPPDVRCIWCFPAAPEEKVSAFAQEVLTKTRRLVVLGSTSAYEKSDVAEIVTAPLLDESAPIDLGLPRVRGEEYLRRHHGAVILRVAGIYGPGRNVVDWIRRGRVGPLSRYVNLIHVEDLANICLLALERGRRGAVYNVSDGCPRRWVDICEEARRRWGGRFTEGGCGHERRQALI